MENFKKMKLRVFVKNEGDQKNLEVGEIQSFWRSTIDESI